MTVILARLRQAATWVGVVLITGFALAAVYLGLRRRRPSGEVQLLDALERSRRVRELASARAAVEIAATRAKADAERDELLDVLNDPDEVRQAERLIAMGKRLKGDS